MIADLTSNPLETRLIKEIPFEAPSRSRFLHPEEKPPGRNDAIA